ncbi:STAS domain-containing protein [Gelidibacter sediminis]|uniref:STAS domain-containing protein n=1 Tax=Gelidibacter sediminis TaxID=1608710 RepID=A0A4R7Q8M5_9FLAO|nr:STAS domain-containing protein [Gelidibacter sediminis]TDU43090.1 STAS domain-containing protein [Gelidibacter sediminis]
MDLKITHHNNLFKVQGILHKGNVHVFKTEFSNVFENLNSVILNIESLTSIDRYGVNALAQLHNESLKRKKDLSIIGMGCDDLYEHFKSEENAA